MKLAVLVLAASIASPAMSAPTPYRVDSNADVDVVPRTILPMAKGAVAGSLAVAAVAGGTYGLYRAAKATIDAGTKREFEAFEGQADAELVDEPNSD